MVQLTKADHFRRAVMASACQPVFMPAVEVIPGAKPLRQYVDGGVREYAGIQLAIEQGADEVFVILLSSGHNQPVEKAYAKVPDILLRTIEIFTEDVGDNDVEMPLMYNKALDYLNAVRDNMKQSGMTDQKIDQLFAVPGNPLSNKRPVNPAYHQAGKRPGRRYRGLDFVPDEMKGMVAKGTKVMNSYIAGLTPAAVCWHNPASQVRPFACIC